MKTKKIVIIASAAESLLNFRLQLIKDFLTHDYQVTAIAPNDENVEKQLKKIGVNYLAVTMQRNGINPVNDLITLLRLFWLIKKEEPDIVFSYTIKPVIYGSIAAKLAGVPNIFSMLTGMGYAFLRSSFKNRIVGNIAKKLYRFALQYNQKIFFQNKDNLADFLQLKLISEQQSVVIVNGSGVDTDFFSPQPLPEKITFLMIARLLYDKGIREYLAAAKLIKASYPGVIFKLVGYIDTNPNSMTQRELTEWVESGVIDYLGKLTDVRDAIKDSSIYVLPSYSEGTPRTVLEAMSMERPIITTDAPGCRETVVNTHNGFLVPIQDVEALSAAMEYFIQHSEEIAVMGKASREIAVHKYNVHRVNHLMLTAMNITTSAKIITNNRMIEVE